MCFRESSQGKQQSVLVSEENSTKSKTDVKIWQQQDDEKKKPNKNESNTKPQTIKKID